jgi:hypothetical protein
MDGNFAILNSCAKKWSDLAGKGRARFCTDCKTLVHDLSAYTPDEWHDLWTSSNGHVCGLLCGESSAPQRSRRAILVGALLTAFAPLWAQVGRVRIRVIDRTGAVIPAAKVALLGANYQPVRTVSANDAGEVVWTDLPLGDSRFEITAPGFGLQKLTVTIDSGEEQKLEAHLEGFVGEVVMTHKRKWWRIF